MATQKNSPNDSDERTTKNLFQKPSSSEDTADTTTFEEEPHHDDINPKHLLRRESDGRYDQPPMKPPTRSNSRYRRRVDFSNHRLTSFCVGESEVEKIAKRIERRQRERLPITAAIRRRMIQSCHHLQKTRGRPVSKIHIDDLREYRDEVQDQRIMEEYKFSIRKNVFKQPPDVELLLNVLNKAVAIVENDHEDEWFHYMDFAVYYTTTKAQFVLLKHPLVRSLAWILLFYSFTPLWFCVLAPDDGVCQKNEHGEWGWMSSIYFASATLSTVGYGDVSVTYENKGKALSGIFYMILANITLFCAFSGSYQHILAPFRRVNERLIEFIMGHGRPNKNKGPDQLYKNLGRLRLMRLSQIFLTFLFLNISGAIVARLVTMHSSADEEEMDWITALYWAVQTTTTIGYGDVPTSYSLRWFQTFYLILSTFFVGQTLGALASLRVELKGVRRITAWKRREISKGLIDELQSEDHDDKVDQFEFAIASLVTLNKLSYEDLQPIMNKYRELANESGFISIKDAKAIATTEGLNESLHGHHGAFSQSFRNLRETIQRGSSVLSGGSSVVSFQDRWSSASSLFSSTRSRSQFQHHHDAGLGKAHRVDSSVDFEQCSPIGRDRHLSTLIEYEHASQESLYTEDSKKDCIQLP